VREREREELLRLDALRVPLLAAELRDRPDDPVDREDADRDDVDRDDGRLEDRLDPPDLLLAERDDPPVDLLRLLVPPEERPLEERPLVERPLVDRLPLALLLPVPRELAARLLSERLLVPRAAVVELRRVADLLRPRG
jgi:hypothetical protein